LFVLLLVASLCSCRSAEAPGESVSLADRVEAFEDRSRALSIDELSLPSHWGEDFRRPRGNLNSDLAASAFWIRLRLDSALLGDGESRQIVSSGANLVQVDAYATADEAAPFQWERLAPAEASPVGIAAFGYELPVSANTAWIVFRVQNDRAFLFSPRLETAATYEFDRRIDGLRTGTYYGLMTGAIVYNLFLALWLRERAYFFYVLFESAFCATVAEWDRSITLDWPLAFLRVPEGLSERFMVLTGAFAVLFARDFLDLRAARRITSVAVALTVVETSMIFFPVDLGRRYFFASCNLVVMAAAVHISFMAIYSWYRGNANAPLFLLGWGTLLLVIIGGALMNLGAMAPEIGYSYVIRFGSATEAMMLAAALARRISAMKRAEADTRAALAEARIGLSQVLERQLASLNTLVGGIAHEIGNPLNFAAGGAKEVLERLQQAETLSDDIAHQWTASRSGSLCDIIGTARRAAALTARGTERIGGIVKNLRAYVGTGAHTQEVTNVHDCIRSTIALLERHLQSKRVEVELDLRANGSIPSRPGELNQVVMNLVLNACQAMPEGGQIDIVSEEIDGALRIAVRDSGPGVPAELREGIFDPFFTTRAPHEGSGLGLSVSREIVGRHGGTLDLLAPRADRTGAEFVITLPRS
jgi:signal transduction histidine kinase